MFYFLICREELQDQISRLSQDAMDYSLNISGLHLQLKYVDVTFRCHTMLSVTHKALYG